MSKMFYPKIAFDNIKKNSRSYRPYILTCILSVAMYYIIISLSQNKGLDSMAGASTLRAMMGLGGWVSAIFIVIFLFYTNSFLMKNRKKEFGLFNILGMEKRHISRVVAFETLYVAIISLVCGLALGVVFDKLMFLLLAKLLRAQAPLGFYISKHAMVVAVILFGASFFVIFLNSVRQIHLSKPVELLQGGNVGEKEPKAKVLMAVLGLLLLGGGYYISLTTEDIMMAIVLFFAAVVMVIIGTYLLFTSGSIVWLKMLKKNKEYYYQPRHFISVSGMIYRMKQNAVGLASICILSTMVLVMVSGTASLMIGVEDILNTRYPYDINVYARSADPDQQAQDVAAARQALLDKGFVIKNEQRYHQLEFSSHRQENQFLPINVSGSTQTPHMLNFRTLDDYNRASGKALSLERDQVLIYIEKGSYVEDTIEIFGRPYRVAKMLDHNAIDKGQSSAYVYTTLYIVVKDMDEMEALNAVQAEAYGDHASKMELQYGVNIEGDEVTRLAAYEAMSGALWGREFAGMVESREAERPEAYGLYGGFFFLGLFLGTLFLVATILIIYYKQISEGYEDQQRFDIMQKVGMSHEQIWRSIRSQVLIVFFLPLAVAGVHLIFAFPIVKKLLAALSLTNIHLYLICTLVSFLLFSAIYCLVYLRTAKTYYRIVSR